MIYEVDDNLTLKAFEAQISFHAAAHDTMGIIDTGLLPIILLCFKTSPPLDGSGTPASSDSHVMTWILRMELVPEWRTPFAMLR